MFGRVFLFLSLVNLVGQITYLNFTGLTNSNPITNVAIGTTGYTFDANITRVGTPGDPLVTNSGNIDFKINSATSKQCLNLSFSAGAQLVVTHNTVHSSVLNAQDSLTIDE